MIEYRASLLHGVERVTTKPFSTPATVEVQNMTDNNWFATARETSTHLITPDFEQARQWGIDRVTERIRALNREIDEARTVLKWFVEARP